MTRIGIVATHPRAEERMLLDRAADLGHEVVLLRDVELALDVHAPPAWGTDVDVVLVRSLSLHRATAIAAWLERWDVPVVNRAGVLATCGDKWATSLELARAGVPTPATRLTFDADPAADAARELGFPVVTKPLVGSWARLVARHRDPEALATVLDHKRVLGHAAHQLHYLQEHVEKPGYDVRSFVVGDTCIAAIRRASDHWITNTARGGRALDQPVTDEVARLSMAASRAVGGGILAVDLLPTPDGSLVVHEVNATMEFRNSVAPTGVDIPGRILRHLAAVANAEAPRSVEA